MCGNEESPGINFSDSSQLTRCILYSGEMCHMIPHVSGFIPGSLEDTVKHIEYADGHHFMEEQN